MIDNFLQVPFDYFSCVLKIWLLNRWIHLVFLNDSVYGSRGERKVQEICKDFLHHAVVSFGVKAFELQEVFDPAKKSLTGPSFLIKLNDFLRRRFLFSDEICDKQDRFSRVSGAPRRSLILICRGLPETASLSAIQYFVCFLPEAKKS